MAEDQASFKNLAEGVKAELPWYVVRTKVAQEKLAKANLLRQGYQVYLPLVKILKLKKRHISQQEYCFEPMFPRYIFFRASHAEHSISPVRSSIGIQDLVRFGGEAAKLSVEILRKIQAIEERQHKASFEELSGLTPGKKVVVNAGPLVGLEGLISKVSNERVMVLMELLGRQTQIGFSLTELRLYNALQPCV